MEKEALASRVPGLAALLAAGLLVAPALAGATPTAASAAGPCPSTLDVDGRTAHLTAFVCGTVSASVGLPYPVTLGVTVGHCTGCECGYVWQSSVGSQFTRRTAAECGLGSGGGSLGGGDEPTLERSNCEWGKDYIGWDTGAC